MNVLVVGGTRFFGVHLVRSLLRDGHQVTIATRGNVKDEFGDRIQRIVVDRTDASALQKVFKDHYYDVVCDNIAYGSRDVKYLLEAVRCGRYILTSSISVYPKLGWNTTEEDFDAVSYPLIWCSREDYSYNEIKRQAECALFQEYPELSAAAVRFPYVVGEDDYTKRLFYYVEHIQKEIPMNVDHSDKAISFIRSSEAGDFLAWIACSGFRGPINACSMGTITLEEIFQYIEKRTGKKPIFDRHAEAAPYSSGEAFSLNTQKAAEAGFSLSEMDGWIYELLDYYIVEADKS